MNLTLIRHARAEERDESRWPGDRERPVTSEGAGKFFLAARGLERIVPEVDVVLTSPFRRAWQTAAILRQECDWPEPTAESALEPDRSLPELIRALCSYEARSFVVVGHEPSLSAVLAFLIGAPAQQASGIHFLEGSACSLELDMFTRGAATMGWMLPQSILRRVRRKRRLEEHGPELRVVG